MRKDAEQNAQAVNSRASHVMRAIATTVAQQPGPEAYFIGRCVIVAALMVVEALEDE